MLRRLVPALAVLALLGSCQKFAEGRQLFRDLLTLRDQVTAEYHEKGVDVTISNGDRVSIKFVNSPLGTGSKEEKQKRADDVATFVTAHYKHPLSSVTTTFVARAGGVGVSVSSSESFVGHPSQKQ
jgi:hypothetical protein